jgi:DNA-binding CsgD family transcriptional regulator
VGTTWPLTARSALFDRIGRAYAQGEAGGVVLTGAAGVGKTRLAHDVLARVATAADRTEWVVASQSASTVPLGAVGHLVPGAAIAGDRETILRGIVGALERDGGEGRLLLGVDDAHLLDDASAALVGLLLAKGAAAAVVTVRSGAAVPDPIVSLWKDGPAPLVAIQPLARSEVEIVVSTVLEGHIEGSTLHFLWSASAGNALFLRELVRHGVESGALRPEEGVWRWPGRLELGARLHDLVALRMGTLDDSERSVLELVAIGEPISVACVRALGVADTAGRLERRGLLAPRPHAARELGLAHPLFGEVVRAEMPSTRRDEVLLALADALEAVGGLHEADRFRVALWRADAGDRTRPVELRAAAERAWLLWESVVAERLARAALDAGPDLEAVYILGSALSRQGRSQEALDAWRSVPDLLGPDRITAMLAMAEAGVLHYQLDRPDDARLVIEDALGKVVDDSPRRLLDGALAVMGARSPFESTTDPRELAADARVALAAAMDWTGAGRFQLARTTIDQALETSADQLSDSPVIALMLRSTRAWATLLAGDILDAEGEVEREYSSSVRTRADYPRVTWCLLRGVVAVTRGRPVEAAGALREGLAVMGSDDRGLKRPMSAYLAMAAALSGDADAGREDERRAEAARSTMDGLFAGEVARAHAWVLAAAGELSAAADQALAAARLSMGQGRHAFEVCALHDAIRFGRAADVLDRIEDLAETVEGPYAAAMATHVRALVDNDGPALDEAAAAFSELGLDLFAAEACVAAARAHRRVGRRGSAFAALERSRAHVARCQGARTPTLVASDLPDDLTSREHEVADLAASELTSRAIAQRLGITTRTVDNLLGRVYTKLGISSRQDLRDLFEGSRQA